MRILRIVLQIFTFVLVFTYPSRMDSHLHIFLSKKVSIKINKNHPSYVAYDAVNIKKTVLNNLSTEISAEPLRVIQLSTDSQDEVMNHFHPLAKKMVLNSITIKKDVQAIDAQVVNENYIRNTQLREVASYESKLSATDQRNWVAEFKPYFRKKIQDSSSNALADVAQTDTSLAQVTAATKVQKTFVTFGRTTSGSSAVVEKDGAKSQFTASQEKVTRESNTFGAGSTLNRIVGIVEIGNLPFTNEHHIEIRRFEEGVFRENGTANLQEATYEIFPNDLKGFLLGRLVDKTGKILGEGVVRISDSILSKKGAHQGPKILIKPKSDINGQVVSSYNIGAKNLLNGPAKVTIFQGQNEKNIGKDGQVKYDNVVRNSSTTLVAESKGHFTSQQIIVAGENFSTELMPEKMGIALKQMVSDLKQQNLNDPNLSIILGKVTFDGTPVSGVNVKIENNTEVETIYFNSLMLPDVKLKTTSENGYYALIVEGSDLMTLMAYRGDGYFGHINTVVSPGMTSYTEIQNSIKTENVEIKVYDPFSGTAESAELELQGQSEQVIVENGMGLAQLPYLGRWSFLYSTPSEKYLPAHYTYVEKSDYIYVPVLSREWMNYVFSSTKRSIFPGTSIVAGFVVDEDFEVELPGIDHIGNHLVYFDYSGKVVERGSQGGGFILYNLPEGIYEPLVFGSKSQKVYSRIAPLKTSDVFIFTYKLDGSL